MKKGVNGKEMKLRKKNGRKREMVGNVQDQNLLKQADFKIVVITSKVVYPHIGNVCLKLIIIPCKILFLTSKNSLLVPLPMIITTCRCVLVLIVSSPLELGGGVSRFWNLDKEVVLKKLLRNRGVIWKEELLLESGGRDFQIVSSVFIKKSMFSYFWNIFFGLVNIHTFCNQ